MIAPRIVLVSLVVGLFALGCSCGGLGSSISDQIGEKVAEEVSEAVLEGASGAKSVEIDGQDGAAQITLDGPDGQVTMQTGEGTQVPADFPLPVYKGATVMASWSATGGDGAGSHVVLSTPASPADVAGFYEAALGKLGGKPTKMEVSADGKQQFMLGVEGGEIAAQIVIVPDDSGATMVTITTTKQPR